MVEKMSSELGQNSRASNALMKRNESIARWKASDTAKEKPVRHAEQFKIKFNKGICLLSAVASGDLDEAIELLDQGVDINYTNVDGLTSLHQACIDENEEMVNLLIERGADIEARDNEGWTPLHAAASAGNVEIAQILCDASADLTAVNNEGEVPIDLAEEEEMEDFLTEEIEKRNLEMEDARNEEERIMLEDVSEWMSFNDMAEVLDWQGATALHVAAAKGYNKVINQLLQMSDVDVNIQDNDGWTPVHAAVHWGSKIACEMLTEAGGDFEVRNSNGQAPHELAEKDFLKTVEQCKKKSLEKTKHNKTQNENKLLLSAQKAIGLLKTDPPRASVKGSRENSKSGGSNQASVSNDLDSGTESGESDQETGIDEKPVPQKTSPVVTTGAKVNANSNSSVSSIRQSALASREKKEEAKSEPPPIGQSRLTSRFSNRKEEEEPKREEPRPSYSSSQSRTYSLNSRVSQSDTKPEEKKEESVSNWYASKQSPKDEKPEDTSSKFRLKSSEKKDDNSSSTSSIAERLKKKNEELLSSNASDKFTNDRVANRLPSSSNDRFSNRESNRDMLNRDQRESNRESQTTRDIRESLSLKYPSSSDSSSAGDNRDIQRELDKTFKEVQDYKQKYERALKEKEDLEKQMEQFKEDIDKMQELKNENLRLKDENGALIRVISKLSRTPAS